MTEPTAEQADARAEALERKIESLRHHVKALQMLAKGQHFPMDWESFNREVLAIDAALGEPK